jgi:hypothetical protein
LAGQKNGRKFRGKTCGELGPLRGRLLIGGCGYLLIGQSQRFVEMVAKSGVAPVETCLMAPFLRPEGSILGAFGRMCP